MFYPVYEITGKFATDCDSGQKLYNLIYPQLKQGKSVQLDFTGVEIVAAAFFNYAIGQLLNDIAIEQFDRLLTFDALSRRERNVLQRVIDNAKKYYSDPQYKQAVDYVIEEYAASF